MDDLLKAATWVVCPMCDEKKCVGHDNCPEIKALMDKIKERKEEKHD